METPEIVSHLAQLMRQRGVWEKEKEPKEIKFHRKPDPVPQDEVKLTRTGSEFARAQAVESDGYQQEQAMKVERLKSLVQSGQYKMDEGMVEDIASNIAKMFL